MKHYAHYGIREFVLARGPALSRTAYLLTADHGIAEDLLQSALAKTARHWPRVVAGGNPEGYVRRVLVNERTSWWRRRWTGERPTGHLPERPDNGDEADRIAARLTLVAALRQLPPRQRAVIVLRYYEDLSEAETAAMLGISTGTVKSQASAALRKLRAFVPDLVRRPVTEVTTR
jgi:RNA polymerase sigma-70 factor (sigma-E family)